MSLEVRCLPPDSSSEGYGGIYEGCVEGVVVPGWRVADVARLRWGVRESEVVECTLNGEAVLEHIPNGVVHSNHSSTTSPVVDHVRRRRLVGHDRRRGEDSSRKRLLAGHYGCGRAVHLAGSDPWLAEDAVSAHRSLATALCWRSPRR